MNNMLENKILYQRGKLEYLIDCSQDLQNDDIIYCSEKMDKLIIEYHQADYNEQKKSYV